MALEDTITNLGNAIINLTNRKVSAHSTEVENELLNLKTTIVFKICKNQFFKTLKFQY